MSNVYSFATGAKLEIESMIMVQPQYCQTLPVLEEKEPEVPNFDTAFKYFFNGVKAKCNIYMDEHFPNNPKDEYAVSRGKRYMKVIRGGSVFCFVDMTNGNVLKAASWNSPAKHARGNIYNEDNGLGCVGPYGIAYLR